MKLLIDASLNLQPGHLANLVLKGIAVTLACQGRPVGKGQSDQEGQKGKQKNELNTFPSFQ